MENSAILKNLADIKVSLMNASKWNPVENDLTYKSFLNMMEGRKKVAQSILYKSQKTEDMIQLFELYNNNVKKILGI